MKVGGHLTQLHRPRQHCRIALRRLEQLDLTAVKRESKVKERQ